MIAFTICSNNYYHQARVLAKSWLRHHTESRFFIILVDKVRDSIPYDVDNRVEMIPLATLPIPALTSLVERYNIVELNTAVKADAFMYLFKLTGVSKILYLDPDIKVYSRLAEVDALLDQYNIVVTPHYMTPIDDGLSTTDIGLMGSGLFNLGFIGLSHFESVSPFLMWWRDRLYKYGYYNLSKGMFYDQVWCNYIPVFFERYFILKHVGYNMANWNLHERQLSEDGDAYLVNGQYPLRFFHFSGYRYQYPELIAHYHTRYTFATRPDIKGLHDQYRNDLTENYADQFRLIPCSYYEEHKRYVADQAKAQWNALPWRSRVLRKFIARARVFYSKLQ